ncbi:MAG: tRNA uridine-5-carboxymethylaminomethyl(34) synthesis GTPase MnmE [Chloroflexi bacterium]|nr:tRNA uridine-5-carboxymethylaminomethyl(34) synthesis GTPase MnmE [Chloroflexota bacterium]
MTSGKTIGASATGEQAGMPEDNVASATGDTIVAVATPPGEGAIGVVRVSGPDVATIIGRIIRVVGKGRLASRRVALAWVIDPETGEKIDQAMAVYMAGPRTYTREPTLEIMCHGGCAATEAVLTAVIGAGARLANRGEFTLRAFLNGRIDLTQAEAVLDAVRAPTRAGVEVAVDHLAGSLARAIGLIRENLIAVDAELEATFDFTDDDVPAIDRTVLRARVDALREQIDALARSARAGRIRRHGWRIAIVGAPNAGKSSLFNALLDRSRAIVTDEPGTTRDTLEETLDLDGMAVVLTDTAGWPLDNRRELAVVERIGVDRSYEVVKEADAVIHVIDGSRCSGDGFDTHRALISALTSDATQVIAITKADLGADQSLYARMTTYQGSALAVSAVTGQGIDTLRRTLGDLARSATRTGGDGSQSASVVVTNPRHVALLARASGSLERAVEGITAGLPDDVVATDLRDGLRGLGEITGQTITEEVLSRIFSTFCIGK